MEKDTELTTVVFRRWGKDIIAIFPEIPATLNPDECDSYMLVGEHGACDPIHVLKQTTGIFLGSDELKPIRHVLENYYGYRLYERSAHEIFWDLMRAKRKQTIKEWEAKI